MSYANNQNGNDIYKFSKVDEYLEKLCLSSTALNCAIENNGKNSIGEFIQKTKIIKTNSYQECDDLSKIVYDYVEKLLGPKTAFETIETLINDKFALTANHHGVDYFAQSVQGSMLFSLIYKEKLPNRKVIPIIACGNISLNNLTYPRGILIYSLKENNFKKIPLKFPLFPDRAKTKTVCAVSSIRKEYLENTIKKSLSLKKDGIISDKMYEVLINLLQQDYMDPFVLQQETYSNQAVILNFKLWKKILKGKLDEYKVVYLELEEITSKIIEKDLSNQNSLINITLFDPIVRERLINSLDCKKACWENNMLRQKCLNDIPKKNEFSKIGNCGTHFFWGIDKNQKRISFFLNNDGSKNLLLVGIDENNNLIKIPFQPDILKEKLLKKEIIPSIFLSYLAISFARGIICVGGYYQSEYLPVMKDKLIESLNSQKSYKQIISAITNIETKNYLSGMQTIMIMNDDYSIVPAGPVELIASDGINDEDINKIAKINIIDAHKASMIDTLTDLKMENNVNENWKEIVSRQNYMQLRENLIIRQKI